MSMSHLIDIDLPLSGDSIPTRSEQTHVLTPTLLHNGHVWARERYLPSDCDASVYALAKQGSLKAHGQLLDRRMGVDPVDPVQQRLIHQSAASKKTRPFSTRPRRPVSSRS